MNRIFLNIEESVRHYKLPRIMTEEAFHYNGNNCRLNGLVWSGQASSVSISDRTAHHQSAATAGRFIQTRAVANLKIRR